MTKTRTWILEVDAEREKFCAILRDKFFSEAQRTGRNIYGFNCRCIGYAADDGTIWLVGERRDDGCSLGSHGAKIVL